MDEALSWRALDARSQNLANNYLELGLERGDRIVLLLPNHLQVLVHYLAWLRTGFVAVPLNYRYLAHDIDYAIGLSKPRMMVARAERAHDISQCAGFADLDLGGPSVDGELPGFGAFEPLTERAAAAASPERPGPDDPAVVFFTSGSTGRPKGVTHTQRSLGHIVASLSATYQITEKDTLLPVASLSHMLAQIMSYAALAAGGLAVVAKDISVGAVMPLMRHRQPTVIAMMPYALTEMVYASEDSDPTFENLRMCDCGGDKVATELQKRFQEVSGVELAEGRGRTKQIIVHDGSNIAPQEAESILLENDAIEAAGVVGVPDTLHGQNTRAYVVLKPGVKELPTADILKMARDRIGYKAPEEIVAIKKPPENAAGKIDRVALSKMAAEDVSPSRAA